MSRHPELARRALLSAGLAVTAAGALGAPAVAAGSRSARGFAAPSISGTGAWDARSANGSIDVLDSKPSKIIVHHTATGNSSDTSQSHAFALSRQIQDFHMDSNGWIDTGQNFTNSRGGHLTEGRHKSLAALQGGSQHVLGAHAGEQNDVALGIENEGTYTDASVPGALWESLVELCSYMVSQYGIEAGAIYGHRDFMSTACPGDVLYARLPDLRSAVGSATGGAVVQPVVWPLLRPGAAGPVVSALQLLLRARGAGEVVVNGVFDAVTGDAVARFRRERGVAGPSCYASRVAEPDVFGGSDWARLVPVLGVDASGDAVRAVQVLLTARGAHSGERDRFGLRTAGSVREFQASRGLRVSGVCDRETWLRLLG
ncbi:N-acetylmuramoyl-L-alanine amidase [Saccharopolyspora gloriosae]|uniref:Peptidoglycan hydrolase-like protein with peptidoglycan-binding domain n=1 Tax=Saccharopolyspora gloriosae TaxID=455344 RepID=A0A840NDI7_9PSEU|nr:N-acetylmuramoyl-L-alanine amidase [Saccharopolyspora gloriosae]MBB5069654.1 peptidoglycan hydrolase-like protein with peptidoglycan-binding domain [Saccharopolyspora gloriosae]